MDGALDFATTARYAPAVRTPKATRDKAEALRQAQDFESVFIAETMKAMFEGVAIDPLNGDGNANQSWREMLVDEYAKSIEKAGGFGLAEPIAHQLLQIQEASNG